MLKNVFIKSTHEKIASIGNEFCSKRPCPKRFRPPGAFWNQEGAFYGQEATMPEGAFYGQEVPALERDVTFKQKPQILGVIQENIDTSQRATTRVAPTKNPILGDMVGALKSITTNQYIKGVRELGWESFEKRLWERNYYERVIRNDTELEQKQQYILENPVRWQVKAGLV
jgi:hypothetical protein